MKPTTYARSSLFVLILIAACLIGAPLMAQTTMQRQQAGEDMEDIKEDHQKDDEAESESSSEMPTSSTTRQTEDADDADDAEEERGRFATEDYVDSHWSRFHMPGVRLDFGFDTNDTSVWALGLGYMYAFQYELEIIRSRTIARVGVGPDLMFVSGSNDGFDGMIGHMRGRLTAVGPRGGLTLEAGGGLGLGAGAGAGFTVGAYFAGEIFEAGYFYQSFVGNADWITPHNIGLRVHIPLFEH